MTLSNSNSSGLGAGSQTGLVPVHVEPGAGDLASRSASIRAGSSTIRPRAVLTKNADGFISPNSRAPISLWVDSL